MKQAVFILFFVSIIAQVARASELAVTIDDLPIHGANQKVYTRAQMAELILDAFRKHGLPPVYGFVNGVTAEGHAEGPAVLATWVAAGNPLGNHTYSHIDLRKATLEQYLAEIDSNEKVLKQYSRPEMDYKVFRYPYLLEGETRAKRDAIREHLFKNGYKIAQVTVDYWDFQWNRPVARCLNKGNAAGLEALRKLYVESAVNELEFSREFSDRIFGRDLKQILLAHIGISTALFIDDVLKAYEERGVKFVTLPDAMADEAYNVDTKVLSSKGPNFLDQMARVKKVKYPPHKDLPLKQIAAMCL